MNSSGIKRGLAATAISALAVTGLPFLAASADAATGDSMSVGSVGPTLNAGTVGGVVVLKTKNISEAEVEGTPANDGPDGIPGTADDVAAVPSKLKLSNTALNGSPNSSSQTVTIVGAPVFAAEDSAGDSDDTDGFDEVTVHVSVTTPTAGETAQYAMYLDDDNGNDVDAAEARTQVSQTTSGPLSKIDVAPASQSAAQNVPSGAYTVTLQDAAGRTTQLNGGEQITVVPPATVTTNESASLISAAEAELGTDTFTATGTTVGSYDIALNSTTVPVVNAKATLNVTKAATLADGEVDIVTGADDWDGFGGDAGAGNTLVRVDQGSIRIDIKSTDAAQDGNTTATLNLSGTGITFGGKPTASVSTVLDANGVGSLTITPDAGTVQEGDTIAISGSFSETLEFDRAEVTDIEPAANPFFSKLDSPVDVTVTVVDQFGLPVTTGFVTAARQGANAASDATPQRKAVGSDGKVTFTFTDKDATLGTTENVELKYYADEFTPAGSPTLTDADGANIKYTADGMGSNFNTKLETKDTEAADYDASDVTVIPLADTKVSQANEAVTVDVTGVEPSSNMTVSVDNGALILENGETDLSQGSASVTDASADFAAAGGYQIIGTKAGVVTVTITSANRTETAQFTVLGQNDTAKARNVAVSGPAEAEHGSTQIQYTAVVTDAFGNPVVGFPVSKLNIQVTGPAQFQDGDAVTNASGQLNLNVRVDSDAAGDVSIRVQGLESQFGAAADRLTSASTTDDGKGLPVSSNVATATTTVAAGPVAIIANLKGWDNGASDDKVKVKAPAEAAGAIVKLFKFRKDGSKKLVAESVLNAEGDKGFKVDDKNGNKSTKYVAKVKATDTTMGDKTNTKWVR